MRVGVADDEPQTDTVPASALNSIRDVRGLALAAGVSEAAETPSRSSHEFVLLTLRVPEACGIELMNKLGENGRAIRSVIFVTAHEEHTIAVSEKGRTLNLESAQLLDVLPLRQPTERSKSNKIAVKAKGRILFIDLKEVISVHAEGNYVLLQKISGSHLLRATISEMVSKLEPYGFIRIHRSLLVNTVFVEEIRPYSTGDYGLRIRGGKQYRVSRTYKRNLKSLANCWVGTDTFLCE